ncbi:MAG: hypothetical protein R3C45_11325 [Phycisphaerales bacterium]
MADTSAYLAAELEHWPSKKQMASLLQRSGLTITVGRYSIRLNDFSHFVIQEYGGDLGDPQIEADADSVEQLMRECEVVSQIFSNARIRHRFEVYDSENEMAGYLHYDWPLES